MNPELLVELKTIMSSTEADGANDRQPRRLPPAGLHLGSNSYQRPLSIENQRMPRFAGSDEYSISGGSRSQLNPPGIFPRTSPGEAYSQSLENKWFFQVIDIPIGEGNVTALFSRYLDWDGIQVSLPPQNSQSIRVILDGRPLDRPVKANEIRGRLKQCHTYDHSPHLRVYDPERPLSDNRGFYDPSRKYQQPVLRRIWEKKHNPGWFISQIYGWHNDHCNYKHSNDNWVLEKEKYEKSNVSFTSFIDPDGNLIFICFAPKAMLIPNRGDREYTCATLARRWLESIENVLCDPHSSRPKGKKIQPALQFLMLEILSVTVHLNAEFLDYFLSATAWQVEETGNKPANLSRGSIITLRNIQESFIYLSSAIKHLTDGTLSKPAQGNTSSELSSHLACIKQDCNFYKLKVSHSITMRIEALEVLTHQMNAVHAGRVTQLTILAAIFLPLSLATGILSMQSRFVELGERLYDFVGLFFILGTIAIFLLVITRSVVRLVDYGIHYFYPDRSTRQSKRWDQILIAVLWCYVTVSFVVGMATDSLVGFRVLVIGIGIAAFTPILGTCAVYGMISFLVWVCGKFKE